jgi:Glycosyltransferase (GlcNAc)
LTTQKIPMRLLKLRENNEIVGERLGEIRAGTETVEEVLHGSKKAAMSMAEDSVSEPPMEFDEIKNFLEDWIKTLHETLVEAKHENQHGIWKTYHDLTVKTLYPWDREYLQRMPPRRDDGSIFLSLATYRDENCLNTVKGAFSKAKNPELLFVGIVQQNCHANCRSGVLANGKMEVSSI